MCLFFILLKLYLKTLINNIRFANIKDKVRLLFVSLLGFLFFVSTYLISYEVIIYISSLPIIGNIFMFRILALALLTNFVMIIFSSLITNFSTMYNSFDIEFLLSLPIGFDNIFLIKFLLTVIRSSWMLFLVILPFTVAFAFIKMFSILEFFFVILAILIKIITAVSLGVILSVLLSYFFPSKIIRNYVLVFIIFTTALGYSLLILSQPEKLIYFENFPELLQYLEFLSKSIGKVFSFMVGV